MAAQLLPIIKAIAPYIAQVASVAIPAFTSKKDTSKSENFNLLHHKMHSLFRCLQKSCNKQP